MNLFLCNWPRHVAQNCSVGLVSRNSPQSKIRYVVGNCAFVIGKVFASHPCGYGYVGEFPVKVL